MATIYGTGASEQINFLDGTTEGDDIIYGLGGNDEIHGGGGADQIYGGSGNDTASYAGSVEDVVVSLLAGQGWSGDAEGDTLHGIQNLTGSWYGDDFLIGNDADNVLSGLDGDDIFKGGGGADTFDGGTGWDTVSYVDSDAGVFVSFKHQTAANGDAEGDKFYSIANLTGSAHGDNLWGSDTTNVLNGGEGNDTLKGYGGGDTLNGGLGADIMAGGEATDTYFVDNAGDKVTELANQGEDDKVFANVAGYVLTDHVEILSLAGSLVGVNATGNAQSNTIFGNANDNVLNGGDGNDALSGLGGNDTFVFKAGEANGDVIYEFSGNGAAAGDVLKFEGYGTLAQGATFHQRTATEWQINSADGTISEIITLAAGAVIDTTTDIMFV
jgi:Ca2+-binding RTX toxin-like protein